MKTTDSLRVLVSPLDWGLGHTTRCIPVIKSLLQAGCSVYVACNETSQRLLSKEPGFASVHYLTLRGYNIRYASSKRWFALKILQQIPKIIFAIRYEHNWLKKAVQAHSIDLIISDNRYGFFHKTVSSVFITHQLSIQTPYRWLSQWVQTIAYRYIHRFTECWVPDYEGDINIAGALSHPRRLPSVPVTYIGPLARFSQKESVVIQYQWLFLLSGPEPQRTLLEQSICRQLSFINEKVLLVRGLPVATENLKVPDNVTVFNHLPTNQLAEAFAQSEYIVSRSGYTTVMEIIAMQKKSILIPTPGQTEQEYLATHLAKQQWCFGCNTADSLLNDMKEAQSFPYRLPALPAISLQEIVNKLLANLKV